MHQDEVIGNGVVSQEILTFSKLFDSLRVDTILQVRVIKGEQKVEVRGDSNVLPRVRGEVVGSTLHLTLQGSVKTKLPLTLFVSLPAFVKLTTSGVVHVTAEVTGKRFEVELSGTSRVVLNGTIAELKAELSGASTLEAAKLEASNADIRTDGASSANVQAIATLRVNAGGASSVRYRGAPRLTQRVSGVASLEQVES